METGNDRQPTPSQRIAEFIQRNRKPIYVSALAVVIVALGSVVALVVMDVSRGRAVAAVHELEARLEAVGGEGPELDALVSDLRGFAGRHSGYPAGMAWSMLAGVYGDRGDWAEAEDAWLSAARATYRLHLAPIAFFNAAAAAEERGGTEEAIAHYERSLAAPAGFFAAPRAQFSIGRLRETLGDREGAMTAYRAVASGWPRDVIWTNLARSRIVALETAPWRAEEPVAREAAAGRGPGFDRFDDYDGGFDGLLPEVEDPSIRTTD